MIKEVYVPEKRRTTLGVRIFEKALHKSHYRRIPRLYSLREGTDVGICKRDTDVRSGIGRVDV